MGAQSAATVSRKFKISDRNPADYLAFHDIETQYRGTVTAGTLAVWASTHRYNFHRIVTKVGRNSRVRRDRWEAFLDSRTIGNLPQSLRYMMMYAGTPMTFCSCVLFSGFSICFFSYSFITSTIGKKRANSV